MSITETCWKNNNDVQLRREKEFFLNDSLFGILKGAEVGGRGGGVGIVVAGTGFAEL